MDILGLSKIRMQVLQQVLGSGEAPIDIAFSQIGGNITMSPIEVQGDFPPSKKRDMRNHVLDILINKKNPSLKQASELVYFSFDPILNVDYCYQVFTDSKKVNLFVYSTQGVQISCFKPYNIKSDERIEIERALKSGAGKEGAFASLRNKFSKLLGTEKPQKFTVVPNMNPISIDISSNNSQAESKSKEGVKSQTSPNEKPHVKKVSEDEEQSPFMRFAIDVIMRMDSPQFDQMRKNKKGFSAIAMTLTMFTKQMVSEFPEWDGLFTFEALDDHVRINLLKGFNDETTMSALPYLWRRKSFVENCILFGVLRLVFVDRPNRTFDEINLSEIDPYTLS